MICYTEIGPPKELGRNNLSFFDAFAGDGLWEKVIKLQDKNFKQVRLSEHNDIWKAFKKLFGGKTSG